MLKYMQKGTHRKTIELVHKAQRPIANKYLYMEPMDPKKKEQARLFDLQVLHKGNVGIIRMNREHRHNLMTPGFVKQLKRGVDSLYLDHAVELIYLTGAKGEHFSHGTDFKTILHYKNN